MTPSSDLAEHHLTDADGVALNATLADVVDDDLGAEVVGEVLDRRSPSVSR